MSQIRLNRTRVPAAAALLAVAAVLLSQVPQLSQFAALLWLAGFVLLVFAIIQAVIIYRGKSNRGD